MKRIFGILFLVLILAGCNKDVDELEPVADFTYLPAEPVVGQEIRFTSKSQNAFRHAWVFDRDHLGVIGSSYPNPAFIYQLPGEFPVSLTVYSKSGKLKSTKEVIIKVIPK